MDWTQPLGVLVALVIGATVIGALLTIATRLLTGTYATAAILVLLLVAGGVSGMIRYGMISGRFISNPYW
jgi:hypothetical protein